VGAGVVGLCTALEAVKKGLEVRVIDATAEGGGGCSYGNSGLVVPSHFVPLAAPGMVWKGLRWMGDPESPFYVRPRLDRDLLRWGFRFWRSSTAARVERAAPLLRDLHFASRAIFEELDSEGGGIGLCRQGLLMLAHTEHGLQEEVHGAHMARRLGIPAEVLTAAEAAAREPGLALRIAGAVYYPGDCHLDPGRLMAALRERVVARGVLVETGVPVTDWRTGNGKVQAAVTSAGEHEADAFVLAAGSWSTGLARRLGLEVPMLPGKGLSLTLKRLPRPVTTPSILTEARVAVTPLGDGLRFGGTMELGGLDHHIDAARVRGIVKSVARYFPDIGPDAFADVRPWCGLRPCSPDGLPYVGPFRGFPNLVAATGHAMMGVSLGPITGRVVAEIVAGETPSLPIEALRPDRFS
jgi:D-amino-acid dehydrogenase